MAGGAVWDWQVGVFGRNEASRIGQCIASIARAGRGLRVLATVLLNGTTDDSAAAALRAAEAGALPVEIYRFGHADKSNAINCFFHDLRAPADAVCCVDAYAVIGPDSLSGFARAFAGRPDARLATGIAINGRSEPRAVERTLTVGGVIHGQLYAPGRAFIDRLTGLGLRLPLGLYRGDGLLGSMAAHDLDPLSYPWENRRVVGVREATYEIASLSPFRPADLLRHLHRRVNHMRGRLENAAIKEVIYASGYAALPEHADDMIRAYLSAHGPPPTPLRDRPFMAAALRRVHGARPPDPAGLVPALVVSAGTAARPVSP
jgi:hypothetical protein